MSLSRILRLPAIAAVSLILLIASGCSSSRSNSSHSGQATTLPKVKTTSGKLILSQLQNDTTAWSDFYAPFTFKIRRPISLSVSGRATMVRDKSILFSARMMGIEVAQLYIDNDSTWLVDKFHKLVCAVPTDRLTGVSGLTIANLQDLMLGKPFCPGTSDLLAAFEQLKYTEKDSVLILTPRETATAGKWSMTLTEGPTIAQADLGLPGDKSIGLEYSKNTTTDNGAIYPAQLDAMGAAGQFPINAGLTWQLGKARYDQGDIKEWTAPSYRRITIAQLIELVKNM